jgi:hypothetical protein
VIVEPGVEVDVDEHRVLRRQVLKRGLARRVLCACFLREPRRGRQRQAQAQRPCSPNCFDMLVTPLMAARRRSVHPRSRGGLADGGGGGSRGQKEGGKGKALDHDDILGFGEEVVPDLLAPAGACARTSLRRLSRACCNVGVSRRRMAPGARGHACRRPERRLERGLARAHRLRHAFPARRERKISISLMSNSCGGLILAVEDDGVDESATLPPALARLLRLLRS